MQLTYLDDFALQIQQPSALLYVLGLWKLNIFNEFTRLNLTSDSEPFRAHDKIKRCYKTVGRIQHMMFLHIQK